MLAANQDVDRAAFHSSELLRDMISRHRIVLIALPLMFVAFAAVFLWVRGSTYTASSRLVIDNRILQFNPQEAILPTSSISAPLLQSQVAILQSDKIALSAIKRLGLTNDPEFLHHAFTGPDADSRRQSEVLDNLQNKVRAIRVGESYLIDVRATATDPVKAAKITSAIVQAYIDDQATANADVANSVSPWLRSKVASLGTIARVVSEASAPLKRDQLPDALVLGLALATGFVFALSLAFAMDWFDTRIKTMDVAERVCGAECLGVLPYVKKRRLKARFWARRRPRGTELKTLDTESSLAWAVTDPAGYFAQSLRNTRAAILEKKQHNKTVVGVTSAATGDGKSIIAGNLARLLATAGRRVLLIDADPYSRGLTAMLAPDASRGLSAALSGERLADLVCKTDRPGLDFLANPSGSEGEQPGYLSGSPSDAVFKEAAHDYDWIVVDLPALRTAADVREAQPFLHAVLLVIAWNKISAGRLAAMLSSAGPLKSKLVGVLLNKANDRMFESVPPKASKIGNLKSPRVTASHAPVVVDFANVAFASPRRKSVLQAGESTGE